MADLDAFALELNRETVALQQEEIRRLESVLRDIALGARMMLESPVMNAALKRYAQEVKRVAEGNLGGSGG